MEHYEIESFVSKLIRNKLNSYLDECIMELNSKGHSFEPKEDGIVEWCEPSSGMTVQITCILGVKCHKIPPIKPAFDPIVASFIKRSESGLDKDAEVLNLLEGDINNGGFSQLFDNKGLDFVKNCTVLLNKIGSKKALKIVNEAISLLENNQETIKEYNKIQSDLEKLDSKFYSLKESIPELYESYVAIT